MDNSQNVQTALNVGDVLPSNMRAKYGNLVLDTSMKIALDITIYGMPKPDDMSNETYSAIQEIFKSYESRSDRNTDSSYWNKTKQDNLSFWNKKKSSGSYWNKADGTSYWNKSDGTSYWNKSDGTSYWNKKG